MLKISALIYFSLLTVLGSNDILCLVGDTIQLSCKSDLPLDVRWTLKRPNDLIALEIYNESERFSVHRDSNGFQNLTITNVQFEDVGNYECVDNIERVRATRLSVLSSFRCKYYTKFDEILTGNICGLNFQSDDLNFYCDFKFKSHLVDSYITMRDGNRSVPCDTDILPKNDGIVRTFCYISIPATEILRQPRVTFIANLNGSLSQRGILYWTSSIININILYFENSAALRVNESVCPPIVTSPSLRTNLKCDYAWYHEETGTVKADRNLTIKEYSENVRGTWTFNPKCYVRDRLCIDLITEKIIIECPRVISKYIFQILASLSILILIAGIICAFYCLCKRGNTSESEPERVRLSFLTQIPTNEF
jgi:hypothetical protein